MVQGQTLTRITVSLGRGPDRPGPWETVEELELATLGWVHWHNQERLHGLIRNVLPAEFEDAFYAENLQGHALAENKTLESLQKPERFKSPPIFIG